MVVDPPAKHLSGQAALVTGGGRGLGRAIAVALAASGARVAVLARSPAQVAAVAAEIDGLALTADVTEPADLDAALRSAGAELGPLDILVANAGVVWPLGPTATVAPDEWARAIDINLVGAFRCLRAVLPGMVERCYGRIVTITSGAASPPGMPSASAYSVAKAGLELLTVSVAREVAGTGVTANAVRPGVLDTPMQEYMRSLPRERVGDAFFTRFTGLYERGKLVDPAVPARFIARLVVTERTGEVLDVRSVAL